MDTNITIPSALRQLLARGTQQQQQQQHNPTDNISHSDAMYNTHNQHAMSNKLTSTKSTSNLKSSSSLGAWLSKYSLRPGGRQSAKTPTDSSGSIEANSNVSETLMPAGQHSRSISGGDLASAAYITSVETREASGNGGSGELRVGGLRMGRKRFLVYRIQVTGQRGQWWVARRYSEFHDLFQALRRLFPQQAHQWNELFPSKRLILGLSSSADSVMQRRERLNLFLRTLTQEGVVCRCSVMQQFLHDDSIDVDTVPLAERVITERETQKPGFVGLKPLFHTTQQQQQQATKRSISSGSALPGIDHSALYSQWHLPVPEKWQSAAPVSGKRARESVDRMVSMPSFKGVTASQPRFDYSIPMPAQPVQPLMGNHGYYSLGAATGRGVQQQNPPAADHIHMQRKVSNPLEYASAEKRPNDNMPQSMRKKYGLRRNLQYRSDRIVTANTSVSADSSHTQFTHTPNTAATLIPGDSDYVMVDDIDIQTDAERTLRGGSVDSDIDMSISRGGGPGNVRGRSMAAPRRAPLGGIGKNRRMPKEDLAVISIKNQARSGKRHNTATYSHPRKDSTTNGTADDEDTIDADADSVNRPPPANGSHKVSLDDFQLLSIIGKGSYGKVMLARYKDTGKVMAIKVISKSKLRGRPNEIRRVMSERKVLERTVEHPFLVGLQCAFQTKEKLFFCLDYVNGGELFFHLQRERRFGENRSRFYAAEIASALSYLHSMDVVYRDLKPENCLLDARGHVRIVDFGLAKEVGPVVWRTEGSALYSVEEGGKTGTFCGTPEYLAPEVLLRQRYGKEVDWYCLGAVIYEMLTGLPPFYHQDNNTMYQRVLSENLRFPTSLPPPAPCNGEMHPGSGNVASNSIGRYAQDFVFQIMKRDPQDRLGHGVFGTENVNRHPFFHGIDWGKIYRQEYAPPFVPKVSSIFDLSNIDPEFRNEPIPESILAEGQINLLAETAEAERQTELAMQAKLMAFPSPMSSHASNRTLVDNRAQASLLLNNENIMAAMSAARRNAEMDSTIDAFRGFSFVSPWVDAPEND